MYRSKKYRVIVFIISSPYLVFAMHKNKKVENTIEDLKNSQDEYSYLLRCIEQFQDHGYLHSFGQFKDDIKKELNEFVVCHSFNESLRVIQTIKEFIELPQKPKKQKAFIAELFEKSMNNNLSFDYFKKLFKKAVVAKKAFLADILKRQLGERIVNVIKQLDGYNNLGQRALRKAIKEKDLPKIKFLIDEKIAQIDFSKRFKLFEKCPLILAVQFDLNDVVQFFLNNKAVVDIRGLHKTTALLVAVQRRNKNLVSLLLDHNANPNKKNINKVTPLFCAAQKGDRDSVDLLLKAHANIRIPDIYGRTAVMVAAEAGHQHIIELFKNYIKIHDRSTSDWMGFMVAAQKGNKKIVELFLSWGVPINVQNQHGWTALMLASNFGKTKMVRFLLDHEADRSLKNKCKETALSLAFKQGHDDIMFLLQSHWNKKYKE